MKKIFFSILCLLFAFESQSQTFVIDREHPIQDNTTTAIQLFVESAANNNLGSSTQFIKELPLKLKHLRLTDIEVDIVSPEGQRVMIIGPAQDNNQGYTPDFFWDITFKPISESVSPNDDFDSRWNSNNKWNIARSPYIGSYHPYAGDLKDINKGSVVGEWRLEITDKVSGNNSFDPISQEALSAILAFGIKFNDETGLSATECISDLSTIENQDLSTCQGSRTLDFKLKQNGALLNKEYDYGYFIVDKDGKGTFKGGFDLKMSTYPIGNYKIYGINYRKDQKSKFTGKSLAEIIDLTNRGFICANFSENTQKVSISAAPEIVTENKFICVGQSITLNDKIYDTTGNYKIFTPLKNGCDSISFLNLTVDNPSVQIQKSASELSCGVQQITLSAIGNKKDIQYLWSTKNGDIISINSDSTKVVINKPGTYTLNVRRGDCDITLEQEITANNDFDYLRILGNDIYCKDEKVTLKPRFSGKIKSLNWSSSQPFTQNGNNIITNQPGEYQVSVLSDQNCNYSRTITVEDKREKDLTIKAKKRTLSCQDPQIPLFIDGLNSKDEYTITWFLNNNKIGTGKNFYATEAGNFSATITNETKGCSPVKAKGIIPITDSRPDFNASVTSSNPIYCKLSKSTLEFNTTGTMPDLIWEYQNPADGKYLKVGNTPVIDIYNPGLYRAVVYDDKGCIFYKYVNVENKTDLYINLPETFIKTCDVNEYFFKPGDIDKDVNYKWTLPNDEVVNTPNPLIEYIGTYTLFAYNKDTECTFKATVEVINDESSIPNFNYKVNQIECGKTQSEIKIINFDNDYNISWEGPRLVTNNNIPDIKVGAPGYYINEITDGSNLNCKMKFVHLVSNESAPNLGLEVDDLNCNNEKVKIEFADLISTPDYFKWSGPESVTDNILEPTVSTPGLYSFEYKYNNSGCIGTETIEVEQKVTSPKITNIFFQDDKDSITCQDSTIVNIVHNLGNDRFERYEWGPEFGAISDTTYNNYITFTKPGNYKVRLVGNGECMDSTIVKIKGDTIPPSFNIIQNQEFNCINSSVELSAVDISPYLKVDWESATDNTHIKGYRKQPKIEITEPGKYYFAVLGENKCFAEDSIIVADKRIYPEFDILGDSILSCNIKSVDLKIKTDSTNYDVTWINDGIEISKGYDITIENGGQYIINVKNSVQCVASDTITVIENKNPVMYNLDVTGSINCDSTTVLVIGNALDPDITYEWIGSDVEKFDKKARYSIPGNYSVSGYGRNGCRRDTTIQITLDTTKMVLDSITYDPLKCSEPSYLQANSSLAIRNYEWSGPNNYISTDTNPILTEKGLYTVTVYGENGCSISGNIEVEDLREFPSFEMNDVYLNCDETPTEFILEDINDNKYDITWTGEKGTATENYFVRGNYAKSTQPGKYDVLVQDKVTLCQTNEVFTFHDERLYPSDFNLIADTLYCEGGAQIKADIKSNYQNIRWTGPNQYLSTDTVSVVNELGTYSAEVVNRFKCSISKDVDIPDGRKYPEFEIKQLNPFMCKTKQVKLVAVPDNFNIDQVTYKWSPNHVVYNNGQDTIVVNNPNATYSVTLTDKKSLCSTEKSTTFSSESSTFNGFTYETLAPRCNNNNGTGEIRFIDIDGKNGPYDVYINEIYYGKETEYVGFDAGIYSVKLRDKYGCEVTESIEIESAFEPYLQLPNDTVLNLGQVLEFEADTNADIEDQIEFNWTGPVSDQKGYYQRVKALEGSLISLTMKDVDGCEVSDSFYLDVIDPYYPFANVFTPNRDGQNDYFYIPANPGFESIEVFEIFDRSGTLVFDGTKSKMGIPQSGWDGRLNGSNVDPGVYIVKTVIKLVSGEVKKFNGTLTLSR